MMMCLRFGNRTQARVLVADWDRNNALTVAAAMHRAGLNAATAFNGKEAVAKAAPPDPVDSFAPKPLHPLDLLNATTHVLCAEWSTDDSVQTEQQPAHSAEEATLRSRRIHRGEAESAAETEIHVSGAVLQQALL